MKANRPALKSSRQQPLVFGGSILILCISLWCGGLRPQVQANETLESPKTKTNTVHPVAAGEPQLPYKFAMPELSLEHQSPTATNALLTHSVKPPLPAVVTTNTLNPLEHESVASPNLISSSNTVRVNPREKERQFEMQLAVARRQRLENSGEMAETNLVKLIESEASEDIKKAALLEMALLAQQQNQSVKAIQIFGQFLEKYPHDPNLPDIQLRQGLLYRKLGSNKLALNKFYGVLSSTLSMKMDNWDRFQRIALQAKTEIADTYFMDDKYEEASTLYQRLLSENAPQLNRPYVQYKIIRCLASEEKNGQVVTQSEQFLEHFPDAGEVPEVRFLLASALKKQGRASDALRQVMILLESQSSSAAQSPQNWAFWQQRTGNEIANQLYQEGDYSNALTIYQVLTKLDKNPAWQLPVTYQVGLVYERLNQAPKAMESYKFILDREKSLDADAPPSLRTVIEMAKWRHNYLSWQMSADKGRLEVQPGAPITRAQSMSP